MSLNLRQSAQVERNMGQQNSGMQPAFQSVQFSQNGNRQGMMTGGKSRHMDKGFGSNQQRMVDPGNKKLKHNFVAGTSGVDKQGEQM